MCPEIVRCCNSLRLICICVVEWVQESTTNCHIIEQVMTAQPIKVQLHLSFHVFSWGSHLRPPQSWCLYCGVTSHQALSAALIDVLEPALLWDVASSWKAVLRLQPDHAEAGGFLRWWFQLFCSVPAWDANHNWLICIIFMGLLVDLGGPPVGKDACISACLLVSCAQPAGFRNSIGPTATQNLCSFHGAQPE